MRMIATIDDPVVIRKILTHLGLPTEVPAPGRRQAICSPGDLSQPQRAARARRAQVCPARESGARAGRPAAGITPLRRMLVPRWTTQAAIVRCVVTEGQQGDTRRLPRMPRLRVLPSSLDALGWLALVLLRYSLYWVRCTRWSSVRHLL